MRTRSGSWRVPAEVDDGELGLLPDRHASLAVLRRLDGEHRRWRLAARDAPEAPADLPEHGGRPDRPDRHDQRVVRDVVRLVEGADLRRRDPLDVLHPADDRVAIGVRLEGDGVDLLAEKPARVVLRAGPPLLDDDLTLRGDLLGVEQQVLHPVRLELDHEVELVGRDVDEVRGHVLRGERVVLAAVLLDEPRELLRAASRRALEHHVLEEMGDPGRAPLLIARADPVPHLEGYDRAAVILEQEDTKPVVERGGGDAIGGGRPGRRQKRDDQEEENDRAPRSIIPPAAQPTVVSSPLMRGLALLLVIANPQLALAPPRTQALAAPLERVVP